jgi:chemotaxis protein MotB
MKKIKELLEKQVKSLPDFEKLKKHIDMTITTEGLRIELTEGESGTFFELGSAVPSASGVELLKALAEEVGKLPNKVSVEGHTDSKPYSGGLSGYSNWELSVDRANAARRIMQSSGLHGNQVAQVRGFADQRPRVKGDSADPANRRISLIVQYLDTTPPDDGVGGKAQSDGAANQSAESKNGEVGKK